MKSFKLLVVLLLCSPFLHAQFDGQPQYQTVFGNNKRIRHGGYGALTIGGGQIDNSAALFTGIRAGWVIDHRLTLGIAGTAFANNLYVDLYDGIIESGLTGGYGGMLIEFIVAPFSPIHISIPVVVGVGGIAWIEDYYPNHYYQPRIIDEDVFFMVEPGLELEMNLVRFMRLGAGVTYRHSSELQMQQVDKEALRGLGFNFTLKFGKF